MDLVQNFPSVFDNKYVENFIATFVKSVGRNS